MALRWFRRLAPAGEAGEPVPRGLVEGFRAGLEEVVPGWRRRGSRLRGPGGLVVELARRPDHGTSPRHVDVRCSGFPGAGSGLWDCVVGHGADPPGIGRAAGRLWAETTGAAVFEFALSGGGRFAEHFHGDHPGGFPGWHAIVGPAVGIGDSASADALVNWWLENPPPPRLASALLLDLDPGSGPHGIKLMFGGGAEQAIAEVSVNGEAHGPASDALLALDWPRLEPPAFLRTYCLLLHGE